MEQHAIPQDVTGFEFKLIGDMTIRQFTYLAGGVILAYLFFKATFIPIFVRWPAAAIFGLGGLALAFLPYQGRPLDRWLVAFVTSIYRPTQYMWRKKSTPPDVLRHLTVSMKKAPPAQPAQKTVDRTKQREAARYLETLPRHTSPQATVAAHHEKQFIDKIAEFFKTETVPPQTKGPSGQSHAGPQTVTPPLPAPSTLGNINVSGKKIDLASQETKPPQPVAQMKTSGVDAEWKTTQLNQRITTLQKELGTQTITRERFLELQKELTALLQDKEHLLQDLVNLRKELEEKRAKTKIRPTEYAKDTTVQSTVKIVPEELAKKKGLPQLTSLPNVVTGIVKTGQGELLPNILVTVKDREEMPVRALKTNKLGQFAASAPLANSTYTIDIEDPQKRYQFDTVEITLPGAVLPPLEIWAKGKKEITRQLLHNDIFGKKEI